MTLSTEQLDQLKENYAEMIIDGMDMDSLCQFAFDMIIDNLKHFNENDMKEEVTHLYDEETWNDLLPESITSLSE